MEFFTLCSNCKTKWIKKLNTIKFGKWQMLLQIAVNPAFQILKGFSRVRNDLVSHRTFLPAGKFRKKLPHRNPRSIECKSEIIVGSNKSLIKELLVYCSRRDNF